MNCVRIASHGVLAFLFLAIVVFAAACAKSAPESAPEWFEDRVWNQRIDAAFATSQCPDNYASNLMPGSYTGPLTDAHLHIPHLPDLRPTQIEFDRGSLTIDDLDQEIGQKPLLGLNITIGDITCTLMREQTDVAWAFFPIFEDIPSQLLAVAERTMNEYPDRFVPFIMSPGPHDVTPSVKADVLREMLETAQPDLFRGYGEIGLYAIQGVRPAYPPDHQMLMEIYAVAAEYDLVVYLHPGRNHHKGMAKVLEAYPDINFVVHGDQIQDEIEELIIRFPNIYYGIDGLYGDQYLLRPGESTASLIEAIRDRERLLQIDLARWKQLIESYPDRFIWGVDRGPSAKWTYSQATSEAVIPYMRAFIGRLDPTVQERFAYKNAERLLEAQRPKTTATHAAESDSASDVVVVATLKPVEVDLPVSTLEPTRVAVNPTPSPTGEAASEGVAVVATSMPADVDLPVSTREPTGLTTDPTVSPTRDTDSKVTPEPAQQDSSCDDFSIFTVSPTDIDNIDHIVPLGNLNPPGHTLPTDHMYVYLSNPDSDGVTDIATLYSPADLTITGLRADQHVIAGFTDYGMSLKACADIWLNFGHISTLSADLFGDIATFEGWRLTEEYSTGGETYRTWRKQVDIDVTAGQVLGMTGGNPGIWAWDFGMVDLRVRPEQDVANAERYSNSWSLSGVCFLRYYEAGVVLDQLVALVQRDRVDGETIPCGTHLQDEPGTAQGNWFLSGIPSKNPEDPHLALVHSNIHPATAVLSVGTSVQGIRSGTYEFHPTDQGQLNRDFRDITSDGRTYGFEVVSRGNQGFHGVVIIRMPDTETLWMEVLSSTITDPARWAFTENKTTFRR
jgi:hypothetical protein